MDAEWPVDHKHGKREAHSVQYLAHDHNRMLSPILYFRLCVIPFVPALMSFGCRKISVFFACAQSSHDDEWTSFSISSINLEAWKTRVFVPRNDTHMTASHTINYDTHEPETQ